MQKMKDSGVAWIGDIPEGWEVCKLKYFASIKSGDGIITSSLTDTPLYEVWGGNGFIGYTDKYNIDNENIVVGRVGALCGNVRYSNGKKFISDNALIISLNKKCHFSYFVHTLRAAELGRLNTSNAQPLITGTNIINTFIPNIEMRLQQTIADYLDRKTAQINTTIAQHKTQIDKLKEYRQSVITEAITKGLDASVPMKDSGVKWIGDIPVGWEAQKFGKIACVQSNLVNPTIYGDKFHIAPEHIEKNTGKLLDKKTVAEMGVVSVNNSFVKGNILYSKIRPNLNKVIIAPFDGLCSAEIYPVETLHNIKFILYAMLSMSFCDQVSLVIQNRVKMPKINRNELARIFLVIPPLPEQQAIADYLDTKIAQIDNAIATKEALITKLTEYKQSLIYEAVTGKMEI